MSELITFFVAGIPATAGSKRAFPIRRKNGSIGVAVSPDNKKSKPWMSRVAEAALPYFDAPIPKGKPVSLEMLFFLPRPKGHTTPKGELRKSAPSWPTVKPDCTKLGRCTGGALSGIAWMDDSQVVRLVVSKDYSDRPGVQIYVKELEASNG